MVLNLLPLPPINIHPHRGFVVVVRTACPSVRPSLWMGHQGFVEACFNDTLSTTLDWFFWKWQIELFGFFCPGPYPAPCLPAFPGRPSELSEQIKNDPSLIWMEILINAVINYFKSPTQFQRPTTTSQSHPLRRRSRSAGSFSSCLWYVTQSEINWRKIVVTYKREAI